MDSSSNSDSLTRSRKRPRLDTPSRTPSTSSSANRSFNHDWEADYFYCHSSENYAMCVICKSQTNQFTKSALSRHYNAQHKSDFKEYIGQARVNKFEELRANIFAEIPELKKVVLKRKSDEVSGHLAANKKHGDACVVTSYKIAYKIAQNRRSFSEGKYLKDVLEMVAEQFSPSSVSSIKNLSLSPGSISSRISEIAEDIRRQFREIEYDFYSIAIDESTDCGNIAQLAIFIRLWDNGNNALFEDLLEVVPLKGQTRGEDIYGALIKVLEDIE